MDRAITPDFSAVPPWVFDLPPINATLNGICTVLLLAGWLLIRAGRRRSHAAVMSAALLVSALFLGCYLVYHFSLHRYAGDASVRFTHQGPVRAVYFFILITHVVLAAVNLPLILLTVIPALRGRFDRHRRLARWTWPSWFYVSVTGVIVYLMLYHWFPSAMLQGIP